MTVRLRGSLPAEEMNGLARIEEALTRDPKSKRIVIAVVDVFRRQDHGDGIFEPTVELMQVELLEGNLRERGVKLLQTAYQRRTGSRQLFEFGGEDDLPGERPLPPVQVLDTSGPRFLFAPAASGAWWLEYRDEHGALLARRGGLGIQADLTLGREYRLDDLDALGDDDLSQLARMLVEQAADAVAFDGVGPDGEGLASQYVGPDGVDEAAAYGDEADENAAENEAVEKETTNA